VNLLANLRRRSLDPAELVVDDANTLAAIDRLIDSDDEREVRLGIETLAAARHAELRSRLERLTADERVGVRSYALDRLLEIDPDAAARAARRGLDHPSPAIRAASVRAIGTTAGPGDVEMLLDRWCTSPLGADPDTDLDGDPDDEVRLAAATALSRHGDARSRQRLSDDVRELAASDDPRDRVLAARVLGGCVPGCGVDRGALPALLADPDDAVVEAALRAVRSPEDDELLGAVAARLHSRRLAATAVETLARAGGAALELVDSGLTDDRRYTRAAQRHLARVGRLMGGDEATGVLSRHLGHRDREVGLAIARALASSSRSAMRARQDAGDTTTVRLDERAADAIRHDLEDATRALRALCLATEAPQHAMLARALHDHLTLLEKRVIALLAIRYGADDVTKVASQLAQNDARSHALAVEWMEVTFSGPDRVAIALVEPGLSVRERHQRLARAFPSRPLDGTAILRDMVEDPDDQWRRPWISACALAALLDDAETDPTSLVLRRAAREGEANWAESAIVHETYAGIRHRLQV
jgi:hypothetical protein